MHKITLPAKLARMLEDHLQVRFVNTIEHKGMITIYTHDLGFAANLRAMGKCLHAEVAGEKAHIDIKA